MVKYLEDSYIKEYKTEIISSNIDENNNPYYLFMDTIFYPQGGGQPSDKGIIIIDNEQIDIVSVKKINSEIRHYSNQFIKFENIKNKNVLMKIDWELRYLHMKLHTAGQLIHNIIELHYPFKTQKAHHFPNECSLEFDTTIENIEKDLEKIENLINEEVRKKLSVQTLMLTRSEFIKQYPNKNLKTDDDSIRVVNIDNHELVPCCGTHLKNIEEIGKVIIKKISNKKGIFKISYDINHDLSL